MKMPVSWSNLNILVFLNVVQVLSLDDIKTHHWCIVGCSAVTGENLLTGVDWLLDDIAARIFSAD